MENDASISKIDEYVRKFGGASRFVQKLIDSFDYPFAIVNAATHEVEVTNSKDFFPGMKCNELFKWDEDFCSSGKCPIDNVRFSKRVVVVNECNSGETSLEIHAHPIFDATGEVASVIIYGLDISQSEALRESEERFHSLFDGAEDAIFIADPETQKLIDCNDSAVELMGYVKRQILEMGSLELIPEDRRDEAAAVFARHANGEKIILETEILKKDGKTRVPVSINTSVIDIKGSPYLQGVFRDISEKRKAEGDLEDLAKFPAENLNPVLRIRNDKVILYANDAAKDILGSEDMNIGDTVLEEWHGLINEVFDSGDAKKDIDVEVGEKVFSWMIVPVEGKDYVNVYGADVTERKRSKELLKESEEKFKSLSESSPMGVFYTDASGGVLYTNPTWQKITGLTVEKSLGFGWVDALHPDDRPRVLEDWEICLEQKIGYDGEFRFVNTKGEVKWVHMTTTPLKSAEGDITGHVGANEDITERKKTEETLRKSEEKFRKFFESSPRGMLMYRLMPGNKLVLIDANSAVDNILKIDSKKLIGKTIEKIFPDLAKTEVPSVFYEIASKGESCYKSEISYDDGNVSGCYEFVAFQTSLGVMVTSFSDISERKKTEEKLREKEEMHVKEIEDRFYSILQNSQDLVYRYNFKEDKFDYVSESVFTILGYSLGEFVKMNRDDYNKRVHPEDVKVIEDVGDSSEEEMVSVIEYRFKKKDGEYIWLKVQRVIFRNKEDELLYSIEDVKDITLEKLVSEERVKLEEKVSHMRDKASETKERVTLTDREKLVLWGFCRYPLLNDEELAGKLDLKRSTLTAIKNRLKGKDWFKLSYIPNFHKLGCQFFSIFDANFKHGKVKGLEVLKNERGVVLQNSQDDKLLAGFVSDKYVDFKRFLDEFAGVDVGRYNLNEDSFFYGLDNIELYDISGLVNSLFGLRRKEKAVVYKFENSGEKLNMNEKRVLDAMIKFPEMSSTDIAKKIWTSKPTVIKVKKKLLEEGFVYPYVLPDFRKLGFLHVARMSFNFDSDLDVDSVKGFNESGVILKVQGKKKMMKIVLFASEEEYVEEVDLIKDSYRKKGVDVSLSSEIFPLQKRKTGNSKMENFVNDKLFGDEL